MKRKFWSNTLFLPHSNSCETYKAVPVALAIKSPVEAPHCRKIKDFYYGQKKANRLAPYTVAAFLVAPP
jgi:hypothetical protein